VNVRSAAKQEIESWMAGNPRVAGETLPQYRRRAREAVSDNLKAKYDASPWLAILLQLLPLLIEWITKRKAS